MRPVDPTDQLFLLMERRQQPMHVGGLQLFSPPEGAPPDFARSLFEAARSELRPSSPFNKRVVSRFGASVWQEDDELDLDLHLRHWAIPQPGRIRELLANVSAEHSIQLDRERPLWESHLIEGLADGRFALYTKVHHALMDGISLMRLAASSLSPDPAARDLVPAWARPRRRRPRTADPSLSDYLATLTRFGLSVPKVLAALAEPALHFGQRREHVPVFGAPRSPLNQPISGSRRVAAQSYAMSRVRAVAHACEATVNDVVLAVCGSALRAYLAAQGALPDRPLIAMVPMSLRTDESAGGNQFAIILADLGTHLADPLARVRGVKRSVREARLRYRQMSREQAGLYSFLLLAPILYGVITGGAPPRLSFNVIISNVPGPSEPQYWNGARLEGLYPFSIVVDHHALNITLTSYCDTLELGIVGCRRTLPSMQRLLVHMEDGLTELERALGVKPEPTPQGRWSAPLLTV